VTGPERGAAVGLGARLDAGRLTRLLDHVFDSTGRAGRGTPVCVWGTHGLGKTMLIEDMAAERGWQFAYCAPAQFEEMGDLHGLPRHERRDGRDVTVFAPPSWVPTAEGPGILLLDDINRADDRILRGLMQLLANFEMVSWRLPPRWHIVATANPEGADYSVTPMDDAILTRMLHTTLVFDAQAWARWATRADVDPRGIAFVLSYPETVTGRRTTPRSLTQFFAQIAGIADLKRDIDLVSWLARATLDESTVGALVAFVNEDLHELIDPREILDAPRWPMVATRIDALAGSAGSRRVDRLSTVCTRLFLALVQDQVPLSDHQATNLVSFLTHPALPNDLRVALHRDLIRDAGAPVAEAMRDKRLATFLVDAM
jgi:MoxR-like ATPase